MAQTREELLAKMAEYHRAHKVEICKRKAEYYARNKEHALAWAREYYKENKTACKSRQRKYKLSNRGRMYNKASLARRRGSGNLSIADVQYVYEENIKKYGTLTCYLCKKPIEFLQDSLDHKIPIIRGGTNTISNLDIAHIKCNSKKRNSTPEEYFSRKLDKR